LEGLLTLSIFRAFKLALPSVMTPSLSAPQAIPMDALVIIWKGSSQALVAQKCFGFSTGLQNRQ
jgi:hypothetical protein